jgi:hypothetical protein
MKKIIIIVAIFLMSFSIQAQSISASANFGYTKATGNGFQSKEGVDLASAGLGYDVDLLYHLPILNQKLAVGLKRSASFIVAADLGDSFDIGVYGLGLWGTKAQYKIFDKKVTPYGALSLGVSKFETPEISDGDGTIISEGQSSSAFGLQPEFGVFLGGLKLSMLYTVPMQYDILDGPTGAIQFNLGYAYTLGL